jgi:tRNA threonylcarbamoyladenosine biosynthesis protein TsaE
MRRRVVSHSPVDTQTLGEHLGRLLGAGDVVCLYGELGSGKTVLAKGLAKGLGVSHERAVRSPSFVFIRRYGARVPVYHADLYRLDSPTDLADLGLREILGGDGVAMIEWADKLDMSLPSERLDISLEHRTEETRLITIQPHGTRYRQLIERWQSPQTTRPETCGPGDEAAEMAST